LIPAGLNTRSDAVTLAAAAQLANAGMAFIPHEAPLLRSRQLSAPADAHVFYGSAPVSFL